MSYNERKQRGTEFENEVAKYLERSGYTVTRCGVEETHNAEFVRLVASTNTPLAKFVRNQPDGYCINKSGIIAAWDAKVGLNISRDAWEAYQHVALIGPVYVFLRRRQLSCTARLTTLSWNMVTRQPRDLVRQHTRAIVMGGFVHDCRQEVITVEVVHHTNKSGFYRSTRSRIGTMPNRILRDWTDSFLVHELNADEERFSSVY